MKRLAWIALLGITARLVHADSAVLESLVADEAFHATDSQLTELIEILLEENPQIEAARADWRAHRERVAQANSLPDPTLGLRYYGQSPETRVGPQRFGLELQQGIPWAGKRGMQAERADNAAAQVGWLARELELELVAALKRAYFEVAYLQEALAVNADEADLLRRFEETALRRYATGEGIQQNVIQVQTDISRLAGRNTELQAYLDATVRSIARLIGRPEHALTLRPVQLPWIELEIDGLALQRDALEDHPRVQSAERGVAAGEARLRRTALDSKPDFRLGLGYVGVDERQDGAGLATPPEDNGQDIWSVSVGINIPLHRKRIRAGVTEAGESIQADKHRLAMARDRLRFAIQESALRIRSIDERARLYRDVIIPQAQESLASAEIAYTTNRQGFVELLDVERVLFDVRLTYHRLLADYWIALADLELGLGRRFPEQGSVQ